MRLVKLIVALVFGLAALLSAGTASGQASTTARYYGGLPNGSFYPLSGPSYTLQNYRNVGGVWMSVPTHSSRMGVSVADDTSEVVAADVIFVIDSYAPVVQGPRFCGSASGFIVPAGAQALYVRVLDAASLRCSPPGVPTQGTITAVFS